MFFTDSAVHRARAPTEGGRGLVKSRAIGYINITPHQIQGFRLVCGPLIDGTWHALTVSLGWYPHIVLIQSHISHVELGSALLPATADLALIMLLVALAPEGTRIFCGVTGMDWCTEAGLVDMDDIRLCWLLILEGLASGIMAPFEIGPWPINSIGSEMGMRMDI